ncbi:hypothetical protein POM88_039388 [Heracleum sosnowskyi]|uniref:Uncharacterized protein n=1 Tax=Heracleum sosnowskyi TaxID=360622 RepID=A0AAD8M8U2_9APIA|nr:hypothetical protein POM88_039388 [Heracleum sosnowskyi]
MQTQEDSELEEPVDSSPSIAAPGKLSTLPISLPGGQCKAFLRKKVACSAFRCDPFVLGLPAPPPSPPMPVLSPPETADGVKEKMDEDTEYVEKDAVKGEQTDENAGAKVISENVGKTTHKEDGKSIQAAVEEVKPDEGVKVTIDTEENKIFVEGQKETVDDDTHKTRSCDTHGNTVLPGLKLGLKPNSVPGQVRMVLLQVVELDFRVVVTVLDRVP